MTKDQALDKLRDIEVQLSPENLSCDGEAPAAWVQKRYRQLAKERAAVIKVLGYEPGFAELWGNRMN